ncbi:MAG: tetratricopeptide repeat protein, partial [Woeseiaceae bacterium]
TARAEYQRAKLLASEIDATSPDNVSLLVWHAWSSMRDISRATQIIERALSIEPTNPDALNAAVVLLTRLWRSGEAIPVARYARERDPLSTFVVWNLARAYRNNGEHAAAAETLGDIVALNPDAIRAAWGIGVALLMQSKPEQALTQFDNNVSDPAYRLHGQVLALHDLGRSAEANAALDELLALEESYAYAYLVGTAYAWTGDLDNAFLYLEKERDNDPGEGSIFRVEANSPLYANLRDDPRWLPFLASVELDPDFLASVEFNPRLPRALR